ncbi:MAG TPA: iron ABC transporter permease [Rhizomicrobium sp.]|jgi:iron complex transport system permease protein|nr:iron ABC transporter permease [Rhizomicrobium sp.]
MTVATAEVFDPARDPLQLRRRGVLVSLAVLLVVAGIAASAIGAVPIAPSHILAALAQSIGIDTGVRLEPFETAVLFSIRLPRVLLGTGVGAILGVSGASLQALFRNPLADPSLIGVSGGAAVGAVGWIVLGTAVPLWMHATFAMPLVSFVTGLIATAAIYAIGRVQARTDTATLLLAGLAINALTTAVIGYLTYLGNDAQLRALTFWLLGGLGGATWPQIWPVLIAMGVAVAALIALARSYDGFALGESAAGHIGIAVENVRRITVAAVALGVGASVALTGVIGFVGLVAPHLLRLVGGASHRFVLPGSALLGALLVVLADLLSRTLVAPAELPIGIVTSALGAPFFIWLLRIRLGGVRS